MTISPMNYTLLSQREKKQVREWYIKDQDGKCYYCKEPLSQEASIENRAIVSPALFPKGFFAHPVHLHHNHVTGMTIGAVHCHCNAVLWQYHKE